MKSYLYREVKLQIYKEQCDCSLDGLASQTKYLESFQILALVISQVSFSIFLS